MKHRNIMGGMPALCLAGVVLVAPFLAVQAKDSAAKLAGVWKISVAAGEETYVLEMQIKVVDGKLDGTVTESMGTFKDVPLTKIEFANDTLKFEFKSATPPDGQERQVVAEFKVGADSLEGTMGIPDLSMTVPATAVREKK